MQYLGGTGESLLLEGFRVRRLSCGKDDGWRNQETMEASLPRTVLQYGQLKISRKKRKLVRNVCQSGGPGAI